MKKKILKSALLTLLLSFLFSINVFAAGLTQDATGIHYMNDDGTFVTSSWVEISNLWFLFDADGVCVNPAGALAPNDEDGLYQIVTSYTPFATTDTALLNQCLANGTVVNVEGQYFITPEASTLMRNANRTATNNTENNFNAYDNAEQQQTTATYVLNNNTMKIHYPSCSSVSKIAPHNYATSVQTVEELIALGYTTCKICFK